ncbi:MAG: efflux RND transporter periplasmic adaptor subunit, partial [Rhizobiaceae bacterium]
MVKFLSVLGVASFGILGMYAPAFSADSDSEIPIRGIVRPSLQAKLATNIVAPVNQIGFREGQHFLKGDILIEFDCRVEKARLDAARATHREKNVFLRSANYLFKQNAGSLQEVETARANADKSKAEVEAIEARIEGCQITAPYDGSVSELNIHKYETPAAGSPLLSIVHIHDPEIELIVPSTWLPRIK